MKTLRVWQSVLVTLASISIVLYFLYFAVGGLHAYFTNDDLMNLQHLHGYFTTPFYKVALEVLNPLTSAYRPLGGVFYRAMYSLAGLNPLPFRYVCFFLLLVNLVLAFRLLRLLSGSVEAALLGVLGFCYHPQMSDLYYSTGSIYDILCYVFFVLALDFYVRRRQNDRNWTWASLAGLLALNLLALQAKEMAFALPAVLLLYEVWYGGSLWVANRDGLRRLARRLLPVLLTGLLTAASLLHRLLAPNPISVNPLYRPTFSLGFYLQSCARFHSLLFGSQNLFQPWHIVSIWGGMALVAALLRSKPMAFGLSFWLLTLIPIALIPGRAGFVMYIPMLGLVLYLATLLVRLREAVVSLFSRHFPAGALRLASQVAVFGWSMSALAAAHTAGRAEVLPNILRADQNIRVLVAELRRLHPRLVPNAQVLFVDDPFIPDSYTSLFAMRLLYNDPGIFVYRAKNKPSGRSYNYVFSYTSGRLVEFPVASLSPVPPCRLDPPSPLGILDDSSPNVCWEGGWNSAPFPEALRGTVTFSNQLGAKAKIRFAGSGMTYVYTKAFNRGIAEVIIDGVSQGVVDLYSPEIVWQSKTAFNGLKTGTHTAEVRVLHQRHPQATDFYVDVDAFVIR